MVGHTLNSSSLEAEAGTGRSLKFEASLVYGLHSEFWDSQGFVERTFLQKLVREWGREDRKQKQLLTYWTEKEEAADKGLISGQGVK